MKRYRVPLGAAVLTVCLAASACGADSSPASTEAADGGDVVGCPTDDPAAAVEDADRTAILRYGDSPVSSMDPIRQVEGAEITVLRTVYDALVELDENGLPVPGLAESWEMVDDDTMEFALREGVTFQDGTPFDAAAVAFNIDRAKNDEASTVKGQLTTVQSVDVVDPLTVRMNLDPPNPGALPVTLAGRPGMMASPTAVQAAGSSEAFSDHPIGAGAYQVEGDWFPVESLSVRAWDGYWDADNRLLGGIDFQRLSFDATVAALKAGDLDLHIVATGEVETMCAVDSMRVSISSTNGIRMFIINSAWEPFDDIRVRQALAYALDREAVADVITNGLAGPAYQWFREGQLPYDDALDGQYNYDPDKAVELLAEAGFTEANPLSFRSEIGAGATTYVRTGEIVQAELAKVGIEMDLQLVDRNAMMDRLFGVGGAPVEVGTSPFGVAATFQPSERFDRYLYAEGFLNPSGQEVPGLRELVEQADATVDQDERAELLRRASTLVVDDLAGGIPLFFEPGVTAYADYVGGVTRGAFYDDLSFKGVYITEGRTPVGARR